MAAHNFHNDNHFTAGSTGSIVNILKGYPALFVVMITISLILCGTLVAAISWIDERI